MICGMRNKVFYTLPELLKDQIKSYALPLIYCHLKP
jgi:hypothetical protein